MSESVWIALITAGASVVVSVVGAAAAVLPLLLRVQREVREVREHVANDHKNPDGSPLNLRDDLDGHRAILHRIYQALLPLQRDVAWLMRRQRETDDRVDDLEDTVTKGTT